MTEAEQRRQESPLLSDRGVTTVKDTVVARIAGMAAGEVEGVHMGGGASRSAGGLLEGITGSDSPTRGVSVEVGSVEAAIDLKMGIDYGKNILGTVGEVRQKITERVQAITGLNVTELNVTISDIVFPEDGQDGDGRLGAEVRRGHDPSRAHAHGAEAGAPARRLGARGHPRGATQPDLYRGRERPGPRRGGPRRGHARRGGRDPQAQGSATRNPPDTRPSPTAPRRRELRRRERRRPRSSGGSSAEAPTDETTLTGGTSSGERAARETASNEGAAGGTEEIDRDRVSESEERRARRRRRREERGGDGEG